MALSKKKVIYNPSFKLKAMNCAVEEKSKEIIGMQTPQGGTYFGR